MPYITVMTATDWIKFALQNIKQRVNEEEYLRYEPIFQEIANDQYEIRAAMARYAAEGNEEKVKEMEMAYEATVLDFENRVSKHDIEVDQGRLAQLIAILKTVFKILLYVAVG